MDICIYAMSAAKGFEFKLPLGDCLIFVIVLGEFGRVPELAVDTWMQPS